MLYAPFCKQRCVFILATFSIVVCMIYKTEAALAASFGVAVHTLERVFTIYAMIVHLKTCCSTSHTPEDVDGVHGNNHGIHKTIENKINRG